MKFPTVVYQDEDKMWIVECPTIPGCVSQGRTREEATENIKEAIALCLEVRVERGMPLTSRPQTSKSQSSRNLWRDRLHSPEAFPT